MMSDKVWVVMCDRVNKRTGELEVSLPVCVCMSEERAQEKVLDFSSGTMRSEVNYSFTLQKLEFWTKRVKVVE